MTLGQQIRSLRKGRQLTLKALGSEVGVGPVTVHEIETDVRPPAPDLVARLAKVLDAPQLLVAHCETCPVCTELVPVKYPHLDNIPTHPAVVTHRAAQEAREAAAALEELFEVFDRNDWPQDPERVERVIELLIQVRDVEVGIRILYEALFLKGLLPLELHTEVNRRQFEKCVARGYCRPPTGTEG